MDVVISGSSGLVGSSLLPLLTTNGHRVRRLVRDRALVEEPHWDPGAGRFDASTIDGADAVVHLAGENIGEGRWNAAKKERIRESRVKSTRLLAEGLAGMTNKPSVLVSASAVGIFGDRGSETLTESSSHGDDFLAEVCEAWEDATRPAAEAGIRVVNLRFGVILTPAGGALARMLLPFKLGAGGVIGSGEQYMSWITLDDAIAAVLHALQDASLEGPVNCVAPSPVTNREFTKTLGRVLKRPTIAPMPAFAAKLAFGEMADALLLASQKVEPTKLQASGFVFGQPHLEGALRHVLGK
jgi:uncharacterized protein (TIGR01777 family)